MTTVIKALFLLGFFFSISFLINVEAKTGMIIKATNNEEVKTIIKVIGRCFINSPIMPGQKTNGKNAASVVAVDAIIAREISPTASLAALNKE